MASQLLMRDVMVHFPAVDVGVDLIAGGRLRLQVKTSRKHTYRCGGYVFTLSKRVPKILYDRYDLRMPNWEHVDYLVCCGIDDMRFWVIPSAALLSFPKVQTLILGTGHHKYVDHDRMESLLKSGLSTRVVAKEMGVSEICVHEHRRGKIPSGKYLNSLSVDADRYEGHWDGILRDLSLVEQIDSPVGELDRQEV